MESDHHSSIFYVTPKLERSGGEMAIVFSNLGELKMYIQSQINGVLRSDVKDEVVNTAIRKARENVYGAYYNKDTHEPNMYVRRYENEGLIDRENFESTMPADGVLEVKNIAQPQPAEIWKNPVYNLSELIEYGHGGGGGEYQYKKGHNTIGDFRPPRPFINPAKEELSQGDTLKNIIKKGLKKSGLTVK